MGKIAIVIPVYKETMNKYEVVSFKNCLSKLGGYDVFIVYPKDIHLKKYIEIAQDLSISIQTKSFDNSFFEGIAGYNRLMLSACFYKPFVEYSYILLHQLDAFVFKSNLNDWAQLGCDYIGAPWKDIYVDYERGTIPFAVGNGGLSLRSPRKFYSVLKSFHTIYSLRSIYEKNRKQFGLLKSIVNTVYYYLLSNNFHARFNKYDRHEDFFWGVIVPQKLTTFKVLNYQKAASFALDQNLDYFWEMADKKLPFGCHSFDKNYPFWKSHIPLENDL